MRLKFSSDPIYPGCYQQTGFQRFVLVGNVEQWFTLESERLDNVEETLMSNRLD